jgi:hypothetical protein
MDNCAKSDLFRMFQQSGKNAGSFVKYDQCPKSTPSGQGEFECHLTITDILPGEKFYGKGKTIIEAEVNASAELFKHSGSVGNLRTWLSLNKSTQKQDSQMQDSENNSSNRKRTRELENASGKSFALLSSQHLDLEVERASITRLQEEVRMLGNAYLFKCQECVQLRAQNALLRGETASSNVGADGNEQQKV